MANVKSAKKRILVAEKNREKNRAIKSKINTYTKKFKVALASGDVALSEKAYSEVTSVLDSAVADGVIHANCAARRKSKFAVALDKIRAKQN